MTAPSRLPFLGFGVSSTKVSIRKQFVSRRNLALRGNTGDSQTITIRRLHGSYARRETGAFFEQESVHLRHRNVVVDATPRFSCDVTHIQHAVQACAPST